MNFILNYELVFHSKSFNYKISLQLLLSLYLNNLSCYIKLFGTAVYLPISQINIAHKNFESSIFFIYK